MKRLRDKKTGEIKNFGNLQVYAEVENTDKRQLLGNFDSFEQILEYYEDYTPTDPYLEDEGIRKFVRDWAKFNNIVKAKIYHQTCDDSWFQICGEDKMSRFWTIQFKASYSEAVSKDYDETFVDIIELCGEEEECSKQ